MRKFRKIVWKIWVHFLVLSIPAAIITFIISACCLDSETIIPGIVCLLSGAWLLWLAICNERPRERRKENETRDKENHVA